MLELLRETTIQEAIILILYKQPTTEWIAAGSLDLKAELNRGQPLVDELIHQYENADKSLNIRQMVIPEAISSPEK